MLTDYSLPAPPKGWDRILVLRKNSNFRCFPRLGCLSFQEKKRKNNVHRNRKYASNHIYREPFKIFEKKLIDALSICLPTVGFAEQQYASSCLDGKTAISFTVPKSGCNRCRNKTMKPRKDFSGLLDGSFEAPELKRPLAFYRCMCGGEKQLHCLNCLVREYLFTCISLHGCIQEECSIEPGGLKSIPCTKCKHAWSLNSLIVVRDSLGPKIE